MPDTRGSYGAEPTRFLSSENRRFVAGPPTCSVCSHREHRAGDGMCRATVTLYGAPADCGCIDVTADRHGFVCGHPDDLCNRCELPADDNVHYRDYVDMVTCWERASAQGHSPAPPPPPLADSHTGAREVDE